MRGLMAARMGLPGRVWTLLGGLLLGVTIGCSPVGTGEQPSSGQSSVPATATATPEGTSIPVLNITQAWPRVKPRAVTVAGGVGFSEVGIAPDGTVALGELVSGKGDPIGVATVTRDTGKATLIRKFSSPQTQLISIAADNDWIVWSEGSNQPDFADWVIYSSNRHDQAIRKLAAASRPDGVHYPSTPYVMVSISQGVVVWSAIIGIDKRERVFEIHADGTGFKILAKDAQAPQTVWPWVMFDTKPTGIDADHLTITNLQTGRVAAVPGPSGVGYFAFDGESVAWITQSYHDLSLMDISTESITPIVRSSINLQFVQLTHRLVSWGQADGSYVFDRKLKVIVKLGDIHNVYPFISEQALDWSQYQSPEAQNSAVWEQLETRDLP